MTTEQVRTILNVTIVLSIVIYSSSFFLWMLYKFMTRDFTSIELFLGICSLFLIFKTLNSDV